jgi:hypothetical protein
VCEPRAVLDHEQAQRARARKPRAVAPERVAQRRWPAGQIVTERQAAGVIIPVAEAEIAPDHQPRVAQRRGQIIGRRRVRGKRLEAQ